MYQAKPLFAKVIMNILTAILILVSVVGNGFVIAVIARFKTLRRSVPNILVANLAVVDLLNSAVNLPFHLISNSEASWYRGKTLALVVVFLSRLFVFLNLASMLAMLANAYLAIAYDFKYLAWKTKKKALICVFLIWFISIVTMILFSIPSFYINTIPDGHVNEYRAAILKRAKYYIIPFMGLFILGGAVLGFLTTRSIKEKKKKVFKFPDVLLFSFSPFDNYEQVASVTPVPIRRVIFLTSVLLLLLFNGTHPVYLFYFLLCAKYNKQTVVLLL